MISFCKEVRRIDPRKIPWLFKLTRIYIGDSLVILHANILINVYNLIDHFFYTPFDLINIFKLDSALRGFLVPGDSWLDWPASSAASQC